MTSTLEKMRQKLGQVVPDVELMLKAPLVDEIEGLKQERNAVIPGHNYMEPAFFHTVPDFVGDSLDLSRKAATTDKDVIVFCGVRFMAETAKILSPGKIVLLPAEKAGCSLAESITAADVRALKARFPGVPVVTYVNTYADVKAESDICCTSGNAAAVVESLKVDTVIFLCSIRCPHMNEITLEETRDALKYNRTLIEVPEAIRVRAFKAVQRMLEIS